MGRFSLYLKSLFNHKSSFKTVRFLFPALITSIAVLTASIISSTDASYVKLVTSKNSIETGGRAAVHVYVVAKTPVNAVDITLKFDFDMFEVIGVDRGQSVITLWTQDPIIEKGKVTLRGGTYQKGFIGEHKIATVNLKPKVTGSANLSVTDVMLLAGDGTGAEVTVTETNDSTIGLYVYDQNLDPDKISINVEINILSDLDGDGKVTLKDISIFMSDWRTKDKIHDLNGDGKMTFRDFSILLANFFFGD